MKKTIKVFNSKLNTVEIHFDEDVVLIDREDVVLFFSMAFYPVQKEGKTKYLYANKNSGTTTFHKEIMRTPKGFEIDHINCNGLDNRKSNLRIVTHQENQFNMPKKRGSTSNYIGIYFCKTRKEFVAQCMINDKTINIGRYKNELEAAWSRENYIITNNSRSKRNFLNENKL